MVIDAFPLSTRGTVIDILFLGVKVSHKMTRQKLGFLVVLVSRAGHASWTFRIICCYG
jgi:hypothetical protein